MPRLSLLLASALLALALPTSARAQCPQPDALDGGPCCTPAQEKLPAFPKFVLPSLSICWRDCAVNQISGVNASFTQPVPGPSVLGVVPPCGLFRTSVKLISLPIIWTGTLQMTYSRTWLEMDSLHRYQVWRFLVNGDLRPLPTSATPPCPIPPCAAAFANLVHWSGYIDYAFECGTQKWSFAWMLTHACDFIDHSPGFPRSGAFHPDRSYTFVGPSAGFIPSPVLPIEAGAAVLEDVRRLRYPPPPSIAPITCEFEEPLASGSMSPQSQFCLCNPAAANPQWSQSNLIVGGGCGTKIQTVAGLFPPGFLSMAIGTWSNPAVYPGKEALRFNVASYNEQDPCTGIVRNDICYGVTTLFGIPAFQITAAGLGVPLPQTFVDQGTSLKLLSYAPIMNVPYVSDLVLNLNFP